MADFFQKVADFFAPQFDQNRTKVASRAGVSRLNLQKNKMQNKLMQDAKVFEPTGGFFARFSSNSFVCPVC
jgi:hypothetical protein